MPETISNIPLDPSDVFLTQALGLESLLFKNYEDSIQSTNVNVNDIIYIPTIVHVISNGPTELMVIPNEITALINNINTKLSGAGVVLTPSVNNSSGTPLSTAGMNVIDGSLISETIRVGGTEIVYTYREDHTAIFRRSFVTEALVPGVSTQYLKEYVQTLTPYPSDTFFNIYLVNNLVGLDSDGAPDTGTIVPTSAMNPLASVVLEEDSIFGPVISMWSIPSANDSSIAIADYRYVALPQDKSPTEEYIKAVFQSFGLLNRAQPEVGNGGQFAISSCPSSECKFSNLSGADCCNDTALVTFSSGYTNSGQVSENICNANSILLLSNVMDYYTEIGSQITVGQLNRIRANFYMLLDDSPFLLSSVHTNALVDIELEDTGLSDLDCEALGDTVVIGDLPVDWQEYLLGEQSRVLQNYPDIYDSVNNFYDYSNLIKNSNV